MVSCMVAGHGPCVAGKKHQSQAGFCEVHKMQLTAAFAVLVIASSV